MDPITACTYNRWRWDGTDIMWGGDWVLRTTVCTVQCNMYVLQ